MYLGPRERTHQPKKARTPTRYRQCLRLEFTYRCVYCRSAEWEVAATDAHGSFEVEHFLPSKKYPKLRGRYRNLYWSCGACNSAKSDSVGSVLDPDLGLANHLMLNGSTVVAVTPEGAEMVRKLRLNSANHRKRRQARLNREKQLRGMTAIFEKKRASLDASEVATFEATLKAMTRQVDGPPHDPVTSCRCPN